LFIPTASTTYVNTWWVEKDKAVLSEMGFTINDVDIAGKSIDYLKQVINATDIVYITGGNTFHLMQQILETGFDGLLKKFVNDGGYYAGASAGAIIAGPNIEPAREFDDPDHLIELESSDGLGFVNFIPFPHYEISESSSLINKVVTEFSIDYEVVPITDDQAIIVEGNIHNVIDSTRTSRELSWARDE
jgi:dipeptidase E